MTQDNPVLELRAADLAALFATATAAASKRSTLPVLSHALFGLSAAGHSVSATDLQVEFSRRLKRDGGGDPVAFTVPAQKAFDMCRSLPGETVVAIYLAPTRVTLNRLLKFDWQMRP